TEAFRKYLLLHQDYLVQTGLPPRSFRPCRWLYLNLARLYDTRTTDSPWPPDEFSDRNPRMADCVPYTWIKTPGPVFVGSQMMPCQYHEADYLNGMRQEDAELLEANRNRLFTVKLQLMEMLINAAKQPKVEVLWADFVKLLADSFKSDELAFFLQMDRFYMGT